MNTHRSKTQFLWTLPQPLIAIGCAVLSACAGVYQFMDPWFLLSCVLWLSFPVLLLWERLMPHREDWFLDWKDVGHDIFWVFTTYLFWIPFYSKYYEGPIGDAFGEIRAYFGVTFSLEASSVGGVLLMALVGILMKEFIGYWVHRLMHRFMFLWRIHATHHHVAKLNVTHTDRTHPLEWTALTLGSAIVLSFLGASAEVMAVVFTFTTATVHLSHCNLPLRSGVYGWIFTTAEQHRVHHSLDFTESNHNFGCSVIVWDRIFGTYDAATEVANMGSGTGKRLSFWRQISLPFYSNKALRSL